jgi:hypothetical protein
MAPFLSAFCTGGDCVPAVATAVPWGEVMRFKIQVCLGILFLFAGGAKSQFLLFTPPGGPEGRQEAVQERLEREYQQARHHLGPVRIAPLIGLRDVAYVRDFFSSASGDTRSDVTATVGAGVRAYLRTGRKVTWVAHVMPEYVWWQKRTEARRLNFSGGLETVLLFNRLTVDAAVSRLEQQRLVTPEIPRLANTTTDLARLDAELELSRALRPFVSAHQARQEGLVDDRTDDAELEQIALLDRDEQVVRAGLHWYPRQGWTVGLGAESSRVDFESATLDSSNEGTYPVLEWLVDRPHFYLRGDLAARSLTATEGSRFVDYDGLTGSLSMNLVPRSRLEVWLYANRELLYSISTDYPYLLDERFGLSVGLGVGERIHFRIFGETGGNDYTALSPAAVERHDDVAAYGGVVRFALTDELSLAVQLMRLNLDSNLPNGDRSYTSGGLSLTLRGNLTGRNL